MMTRTPETATLSRKIIAFDWGQYWQYVGKVDGFARFEPLTPLWFWLDGDGGSYGGGGGGSGAIGPNDDGRCILPVVASTVTIRTGRRRKQ